jgi:hypothetical protein
VKALIEVRGGLLFVRQEQNGSQAWLPVRKADDAEAQTLNNRPVTLVDSTEGIYVDEEGNVYQLMDKGATKPIAVEKLEEPERTELETLLAASLAGCGKSRTVTSISALA